MTKSNGFIPYKKRHHWTPAEEALLARSYPDTLAEDLARQIGVTVEAVWRKAHEMGIKKSHDFKVRQGVLMASVSGHKANRFQPGSIPWNKGQRGLKLGNPETWFKPGQRRGAALDRYCEIGTEKIRDGYLVRKINNGESLHGRWRAVHLLIWEAANGPLPDGHLVVFRDGNRDNIALENLECITRAENMRRNHLHHYGPEIARLAQLRGAITRQINRRSKTS